MGKTHVNDVDALHADAKKLIDQHITGGNPESFDSMIAKADEALDGLKNHWKGGDAGKNINDLTTVRNGLAGFRDIFAKLGEAAGGIAHDYREIQIANLAPKPALAKIAELAGKAKLAEYKDDTDQAYVDPQANTEKAMVDTLRTNLNALESNVKSSMDKILNENWLEGDGREEYVQAYDKFKTELTKYKETLDKVDSNLKTALENWKA